MNIPSWKLGVTSLLLASAQALAADMTLLTAKVLPLAVEEEAAHAAIQTCAAQQRHISVVIVDAYGNIKLLMVSDLAPLSSVEHARKKAYTAAMLGRTTGELKKLLAASGADEPVWAKENNPNFMFDPGGNPLRVGAELVGGLGVSGTSGTGDGECAQAGADKIQPYLK